ncbi:heterokaryon incompatibility protein-domain-containing protein [Halenospora varia]|nr:heterokaryon incompatibility protein-domain-containing protein [Halenospora varia]
MAEATTFNWNIPRLARIRTRSLPKTLRDAIAFTRRLGIQYIWIDSLCIIQDSPEDWQRESALMGKIYSHCFCMIAAAASENCDGGLFARRLDLPILGITPTVIKKQTPFVLLKDEYFGWDELLKKSPLTDRGWVLQERELSPKIVYFTKEELLFECREARGAEMADRRTYFPMKRRCLDPVDLEGLEVSHKMDFRSTNDRQYSAWLKLVQGYSSRKLTVTSDKFPGLSGLASECSFLLNDQYVAGIWKDDIIRGLCWIASPSTIPSSKAAHAKVTGPISYEWHPNLDFRSPPLFTAETRQAWYGKESNGISWSDPILLGATTVPEGKDPNGTLLSAELDFSAQIIPMRQIKTGNCKIGNTSVAILWDFLPQSAPEFFLFGLGGIAIGLALVRDEARENTFRRVGIVPHTRFEWFKDIEFQGIKLV